MLRSTFLAMLLSLIITIPCLAIEPIRTIEGIVIKISDGDSIQVMDSLGTKVKVRLYGIDAPESEKNYKMSARILKQGQPYGEEAYRALKVKVENQRVRLDVMDVDKFKRAVCIVSIGDRNINKEMVSEGYAWAFRKYLDRPYASEYIELEEQARSKKLGLWQQSNPQPPWEFRKMQVKNNI